MDTYLSGSTMDHNLITKTFLHLGKWCWKVHSFFLYKNHVDLAEDQNDVHIFFSKNEAQLFLSVLNFLEGLFIVSTVLEK